MSNIVLGNDHMNRTVVLPMNKFTKHCAIMGMTGSGKSGMVLGIIEQMIANNVPVVLVDIKGDMCNIALQHDDADRVRMNLRVLTPGALHGEQINLFANLQKPERVKTAVTQLLKMCGERNVNPLSSKNHSMLSMLLEHYHAQGIKADLLTLINGLIEPPFVTFGALPLEDAVPAKTRAALASKLNNLLVAPSFQTWREGGDLNVDSLFAPRTDGTTNVTIYSIAHLDDDQKMFAMALLFEATVAWMRRQRGTDDLRAMLVVDECAGILPPHPNNPPSKGPIMTMLKQARAYGLGLVLASQNPMDLDYKALSNCETWIVGRLQMSRDRARVIEAITATTPHDKLKLEARIGRLTPRDFVLCRPKSTANFHSAPVHCDLVGPMTPMEIRELLSNTASLRQEILQRLQEAMLNQTLETKANT